MVRLKTNNSKDIIDQLIYDNETDISDIVDYYINKRILSKKPPIYNDVMHYIKYKRIKRYNKPYDKLEQVIKLIISLSIIERHIKYQIFLNNIEKNMWHAYKQDDKIIKLCNYEKKVYFTSKEITDDIILEILNQLKKTISDNNESGKIKNIINKFKIAKLSKLFVFNEIIKIMIKIDLFYDYKKY